MEFGVIRFSISPSPSEQGNYSIGDFDCPKIEEREWKSWWEGEGPLAFTDLPGLNG